MLGIRILIIQELTVIPQRESKSLCRTDIFRLLDGGQCNGINEWGSAWLALDIRFLGQ